MIGVFDSGVGGLTVVREIKKILPRVSLIYFGDTARLPYGNKSQEAIQRYSAEIVEFLKKKGCKTIVIACNTASAFAGDWLREKYPDLEIYDVVSSGAEAIVSAPIPSSSKLLPSNPKKVGVIGTSGTINSRIYEKKITEIDPEIEVFVQACPLFVHLVEENWTNRPETKKIARTYLRKMKMEKPHVLLLGCTHYPLLEKIISEVMGKRTKIVNSAKNLAKELQKRKWKGGGEEDKYYASDLTPHFEGLASRILGKSVRIEKIVL